MTTRSMGIGVNDFVTTELTIVINSVAKGEGVKNCPKLRDFIYGRPLIEPKICFEFALLEKKMFLFKVCFGGLSRR